MKNRILVIVSVIILIAITSIGGYFWFQSNVQKLNQKEGTWKDYNDNDISFRYLEKLLTEYIYAQEWPPIIEVKSEIYSCFETPQEISSLTEIITQRIINDRIYCIDVKHEGAAGSVYSSYIYTTQKNDKLVSISFTLRYSSCENYNKEQNQDCKSERESFDIDKIVDNIVQTIKWDLLRI
jgi:hypothetical protein